MRSGDSLWRIAGCHLARDATAVDIAQEVNRLWKLNEQRIGTATRLIFRGQTLRL